MGSPPIGGKPAAFFACPVKDQAVLMKDGREGSVASVLGFWANTFMYEVVIVFANDAMLPRRCRITQGTPNMWEEA